MVASIWEIPSCCAPLGSSQNGIPAATDAASNGSHSSSGPATRDTRIGPLPPWNALSPRRVRLQPLEVRQHVGVAPPLSAQLLPAIVVTAVTAYGNHRVDG